MEKELLQQMRANYAMGRVPRFMVLSADKVVTDAWHDLARGRADWSDAAQPQHDPHEQVRH